LIEPRPTGAGYRPNPKFQTFNARSDRLTSSPLWKKAYPSKRCIMPVSAFHEWKGKQVYNIHPENEAAAPLVCEPVRSPNDLSPVGEAELLDAD
jgi:putative SOS response-associated peptidase YedK